MSAGSRKVVIMKKIISLCLLAMICIVGAVCISGCSNSEGKQETEKTVSIEGKWQAVGVVSGDEVIRYEDLFDKETVKDLNSQILKFEDDGKVISINKYVAVKGTYKERDDGGYLITEKVKGFSDDVTLVCKFKGKYLYVKLNPPSGFEDSDTGDITVYEKIDKKTDKKTDKN